MILTLLLPSLALAAAPAPSAGPPAPAPQVVVVDRIAAVVNKSLVLASEVEAALEQMMQAEPLPAGADAEQALRTRRAEVLDGLIAERLLEEEVRKLRVDVTEGEIDRVVQGTMAENNLDEESLKAALARQGLTLDDYRAGLKKQLMKMKIIQLKVKSRVQVTDQDVKARIAQRAALDALEFRVRARHILFVVPSPDLAALAEGRARAARARLERGESFEDLARELSEDPGSKERGGDLGEFGRGEMVAEFERAAFSAEPGRLVGPLRTPFGWHLLRVEERLPIKGAAGAALEQEIRRRLFEGEVETQFRAYMQELRKTAYVEKKL